MRPRRGGAISLAGVLAAAFSWTAATSAQEPVHPAAVETVSLCSLTPSEVSRLALPLLDTATTEASPEASVYDTSLSSARAIVFDFFSPTCGEPCRDQQRALRRVQGRLRSLPIEFVSVHVGDADSARAWIAGESLPWPVVLDPEGQCRIAPPAIAVFDRHRVLVESRQGYLDEERLVSLLVGMR